MNVNVIIVICNKITLIQLFQFKKNQENILAKKKRKTNIYSTTHTKLFMIQLFNVINFELFRLYPSNDN